MAGPVDTRFPQRTHVPLRSCASRASANSSHSRNDSLLSAAAHTPRITRSIGTDRQLGHVLRMTTTMLPKNHRMRGVRCSVAELRLCRWWAGVGRPRQACSRPSHARATRVLLALERDALLALAPWRLPRRRRVLPRPDGRCGEDARSRSISLPVDTPFLAPRRALTELPLPHPQAPRGSSSSVRAMGGLALRCVRTHSTRSSLWRAPGWRRHSSPLLPLPPPPP